MAITKLEFKKTCVLISDYAKSLILFFDLHQYM